MRYEKMKCRLVLILLLTVLICPAQAEGVSLSVDPTGRTEGFSAVLYDNRNGLPTADANAIAETGEGFLWIGSYAGLIRYDGNTFERLDSTNGITSIRSLFVDSRDRLWIGTNANGFAVMERGEYRIWDLRDGLKILQHPRLYRGQQRGHLCGDHLRHCHGRH